jgi:UPF0716 protein FxsA
VFPWLLLVFAVVPFLELVLLIKLTQLTSLPVTVLIVIGTGITGMSLVRWQGLKAWRQIQTQLASGQSPSKAIISGVLILVAGAMLLTPGLLTDTAGFLLLIPPVRFAVVRLLQKRLAGHVVGAVRNSVWVSSFGAEAVDQKPAEPDSGPRPSVRVVDPSDTRSLE